MDIIFRNNKLKKRCNSLNGAQKAWGTVRGRLVIKRLDEICDSDNLKVLKSLPQARCHPLKGDYGGKWAVDLEHPYRLIFEPANTRLPILKDGGPDLEKVTAVRILAVEDYHG
jgi:plasmid maintenance system killer protein